MIRYYLGTENRKNINIIELTELQDVKTSDSLQKIDELTMKYPNEQTLINKLKEEGINCTGKFKIIYKNKDIKKLHVLYSDSKKYMDIHYLRNVLLTYSKDIVFLEKLANHFGAGRSTYNPQLANVAALRRYINDVRFSSTKEAFYVDYISKALDDIFAKAVFKVNKKTGEIGLNYRGLRDLALFVKKYIDNENRKEYESTFDNKEEYSLNRFEYNDNYDEPDFPPNSEEEDYYLNYLESLPTEESDYNYERGKSR